MAQLKASGRYILRISALEEYLSHLEEIEKSSPQSQHQELQRSLAEYDATIRYGVEMSKAARTLRGRQ